MKITIEETDQEVNQKASLECSTDKVPIDQTMDMMIKAVLASGYQREAVAEYFTRMSKTFDQPDKEEVKEEKGKKSKD